MIYFSIISFILSVRYVFISWNTPDKLIGGYYLILGGVSLVAAHPRISDENIILTGVAICCSVLSLGLLLGKIGKQMKNDEELI